MPNYIVRFEPKAKALVRLFCVPYAGATAAYYRSWATLAAPEVELFGVEIPGRLHLKDQPPRNMSQIIELLVPQFSQLQDVPWIFYGHSYGSLIAYELAKQLHPKALFVSSRRAPHLPSPFPPAATLTDEQFLHVMQNMYHAIPDAVVNEKELLELLLPALKNDIHINETHSSSLEPLLDIPVVAMHGKEDSTITTSEMLAWKEVTTGHFTHKVFEGSHFFIDQHKGVILRMIDELFKKSYD